MNFETLMVLTLVMVGAVWLSFFLRGKRNELKKSDEKDNENTQSLMTVLRLAYRGIWVIIALFAVFVLQRFGYVDIPNPFEGPMDDSPAYTERPKDPGKPPELEATTGRPNLQDIRSEHQKQLDEYEK